MMSASASSRRQWYTAAVLMAVIAMSACRIERTPRAGLTDSAAVAREQIENELLGYEAALEQNDPLRAASYFTGEAQLQPPLEPDIVGRAAITAAMRDRFAEQRVTGIEMRSDGIDVAGRIAHQFGTFRQDVDENGTTRTETGRFVIRWRRTAESKWQIERLLINHYPPDPALAAQ